jgi:hypothetical protein
MVITCFHNVILFVTRWTNSTKIVTSHYISTVFCSHCFRSLIFRTACVCVCVCVFVRTGQHALCFYYDTVTAFKYGNNVQQENANITRTA